MTDFMQSGETFTPTPEQGRNQYAYTGQGFAPSARKSKAEAEAEFDRMLEVVRRDARADAERQLAERDETIAAAVAAGLDHTGTCDAWTDLSGSGCTCGIAILTAHADTMEAVTCDTCPNGPHDAVDEARAAATEGTTNV